MKRNSEEGQKRPAFQATPHVKYSIMILALLAAGCGKKNEFVAPPPPPVTVAAPEVRDVTVFKTFPGTLEGIAQVEIRARVPGVLEKRFFEDGQLVKKGAPLFQIEQAPYKAAVTSAEGNLAKAVANRDLAKANRMRLEKAFATRAVSEIEVLVAKAEEAEAEAAITQAKADLDKARISLSYTEIKAPVEGRLSRALVDTGNLVGTGEATLLTTLIDDVKIRAYFEISERSIQPYLDTRPRPGTTETELKTQEDFEVRLELTDKTIYNHPGKLDFIDNKIDPATRTIHVRAEFPNPDGRIGAGMFAQVGLPFLVKQAKLVPQVAILRDLAGPYVWIVDPANIVRRQGIKTGASIEGMTIVTEGLEGKERVIVAGVQRAREGGEVAPETAEKPKDEAKPPKEDEKAAE